MSTVLLFVAAFCQAQTWDGSESTDWFNAANWDNNSVPGAATTAIIPAAGTITNWPQLTGDLDVGGITMGEGSSLDVNGHAIALTSAGLNLLGGATTPITISNSNANTDIYIQGDAGTWQVGNAVFTDNVVYEINVTVSFSDGFSTAATVYNGDVTYNMNSTNDIITCQSFPNVYGGNVTVNRTVSANSITNLFFKGHAGIAGNFTLTNNAGGNVSINGLSTASSPIQGVVNIEVSNSGSGNDNDFNMFGMENNTTGGSINVSNINHLAFSGNTLKANVSFTGLEYLQSDILNRIAENNITGNFNLASTPGTTSVPVYTGGNTITGTTTFDFTKGEINTGYFDADVYNGNTYITFRGEEKFNESYSYPNQYNGDLVVTGSGRGSIRLFISGHAGISGNFTYSNPNVSIGNVLLKLNENAVACPAIQGKVSINAPLTNPFVMRRIKNNTPGGIVSIDKSSGITFSNDTLLGDVSVVRMAGLQSHVFYQNEITGNFTLSDISFNQGPVLSGGNTINGGTDITLNSAASWHTGASNQGKDIHNGYFWLTRNVNATGTITIAETDDVEWNEGVRLNYTTGVSFNPAKKVILAGSSNGNLLQSGTATVIPNVEINKSGGATFTLNAPLYISNNLTFINGNINSDATNFLGFNDEATATNASAASHVTGPVLKEGDDAFAFPVGTATSYNPVAISAPAAVTDMFSAVYYNANPYPANDTSKHAATVARVSGCEYWHVLRLNGSSDVKLTFTYGQPCGGPGYITNPANVHIVHWNDALNTWEDLGNDGNYTGTLTGTVTTAAPVSSFSPFTIASTNLAENALPLTLLSFIAQPAENGVLLNWLTADEKNVSHFDIERSDDGVAFTKIGAVNAVSANSTNSYNYVDAAPQNGTNYYRLRMIDIDGRFENSKIISVRLNNTQPVRVFPAPAQSTITVQFAERFRQLEMVDISGRTLLRKNITRQSETIDISTLAKGIYFIRLTNDNITVSKKFVKE
jgi:hypothetical protein